MKKIITSLLNVSANVARSAATRNVSTMCMSCYHQPKMPACVSKLKKK